MAYLKNWGEIEQVLQDTGASRFNVGRSRNGGQGNDYVFVYDKDKSLDENKQVCERLLQRCAGEIVYLLTWRNENGKTTGCCFTIQYDSAPQYAMQPQVAGVAGLYGGVNGVDMENLTKDLTARIRNEYDRAEIDRLRKQLDEERKEFRTEQKEFEKEKFGTIGILVEKFAPYLKAVAGKHFDLPMVAGVDSEEDIEAAKIRAKEQTEESAEELTSYSDIFSDEEADKLLALMTRFKKVEPQYLQLLESVVTMAENGSNTYTMAKQFLLK